ncbi:NAD(P)-dependent iron-only hydrogenase diaphorase component iron-sulfur protein [Sporobacter termitidis DSM 10068]|uniref:NAD(P)-dependent iron-only hydrogenase diaphorase component iron-sulfur protein n=1 Tax=Sporobacter termitidis DSM 10068 TaxID=1123282 RepID=A0A1M5TY03_9FIRM|nr:NAD(P)H-dependent oxidoreductase subunit E [Sporobacter termitidis]SHH55558.1 NAD(P)-dependent iron-only hydrogenase diaphorase component iron-sulfur protein [Sporobacter termitidis DSM 10068]
MNMNPEERETVCKCGQETEEQKYERLDQVIEIYKSKPGSLIQILHMAQGIFGHIPSELQEYIAGKLNMPVAKVHGVVSFYTHFSMVPKGEHTIQVCMGTACFVRGGKEILETLTDELGIGVGETTPDGKFTLEVTRCIGACGLAPAVTIDNVVYQMMDSNKIKQVLKNGEFGA